MSCLPKPVLRGHVKRAGLKLVAVALAAASINGTLFHFLVSVPARKKYWDWLETYDGEAHSKDLVKWGYVKLGEKS